MKRAVSWLVWIVGVGLSVFAFAALGVREWPWPARSVDAKLEFTGFGLYSMAFLIASVSAFRSRKWAGLLLIGACIPIGASFLISASPYLSVGQRLLPPVIVSGTLAFLGAFWLLVHRFGWPVLAERMSLHRWLIGLAVGFVAFAILTVGTIFASQLDLPEPSGDCGSSPQPRVHPWGVEHRVFTARVVRIGPKPSEGLGYEASSSALVRVEESFWGTPRWTGGYLLLTRGGFQKGQRWFVDAYAMSGIIGNHLPIVEMGKCTRTSPLEYAGVDLRILREGPPKSGVRIIGTAFGDRAGRVAGAKILINGPSGSVETTTDSEGIYDVKGLAAGHYSVHASPPNRKDERWAQREQRDLKDGEAWGREVYVKTTD